MSITRTRNLSEDFIRDVLPNIPHPPIPPREFDRTTVNKSMEIMNRNKEKALHTYWPHLLKTVHIENIRIPMSDGTEASLRVYKPKKESISKSSRKVFFSMHGGGFIAGNIDSEDLINRQISTVCDVIIFSIDYRLAPEYKVTTTVYNDAEDGFKWTFANASKYGGDVSDGIFLSGTSSGGAMASFLAFRSEGLGIKVKGLVMRQPVYIFASYDQIGRPEWLPRLTSLEENADAPLLNRTMVMELIKLIDMPLKEATDPYYCPIFASKEELSRMPPSYFVKAPVDPVTDEVNLFAELLRNAGVPVRVKEYEGMPHGFHSHHVLAAARQEMIDTAEAVKWLLELDRKM